MAKNMTLINAKKEKNDEFYTQITDIEDEIKHYRKHFIGKTVYCNCDDPTISNFYFYFNRNFDKLGLKQLITTCYKNRQPNLFSTNNDKNGIAIVYDGEIKTEYYLDGDGDFRSEECIELLKLSDIIVTNPPFSLFREYIAQLIEYDKKFVVIGNMNAIAYKEIFPLIKNGKLWLGYNSNTGPKKFNVPDYYPLNSTQSGVDEDGKKFIKIKDAIWFTNIPHNKRNEDIILYKIYSPEEYTKYDNYDAINVGRTSDIPEDYNGEMGVPISFLNKYNPDQFEIIGMDRPLLTKLTGKQSRFKINGKELYARIVIKNRRLQ